MELLKDISIIIPCYNEEKSIGVLIENLIGLYPNVEIIVINDGSDDSTLEILKNYNIMVISHPVNKGYGASLKSGILASKNDILIFMDGDGQHNVKEISNLIREIKKNDMVIGERSSLSYIPPFRKPGKLVLKWISQVLTGRKIPDLNSGFRAVKKSIIKKYLHLLPSGFSASTTMTLIFMARGYTIKYVPIRAEKRKGKSTVSPIKDGFNTIVLILRIIMLVNPLRIFLPTAIILFIAGLVWGIPYLLAQKGLTVASLFIMLTSIIIFFIGLLADQVSQLRLEKYE